MIKITNIIIEYRSRFIIRRGESFDCAQDRSCIRPHRYYDVGMTHDPEQPRRRTIRLKDYDYSRAGAYFITICTHDKKCLFGDVHDGTMQLNEVGKIAASYWNEIPNHFQNVELDAFIVMPNHIHGIILIIDSVGARHERALQSDSVRAIHELPVQSNNQRIRIKRRKMLIPRIIGYFKMKSAKHINQIRHTPGAPLWHRNYYEHIIRNEKSLEQIREYIEYNASKWETDEENPKNLNAGN